VSQIKQANS